MSRRDKLIEKLRRKPRDVAEIELVLETLSQEGLI